MVTTRVRTSTWTSWLTASRCTETPVKMSSSITTWPLAKKKPKTASLSPSSLALRSRTNTSRSSHRSRIKSINSISEALLTQIWTQSKTVQDCVIKSRQEILTDSRAIVMCLVWRPFSTKQPSPSQTSPPKKWQSRLNKSFWNMSRIWNKSLTWIFSRLWKLKWSRLWTYSPRKGRSRKKRS